MRPYWLMVLLLPVVCEGWTFQWSGGTAHNFPTGIRIEQPGFSTLNFTGEYSTRPFSDSPYYMWRVGKSGWEIELIHNKVYLENPPEPVQSLEITHGYNLLVLNRCFPLRRNFLLRFGMGAVIAHAEGSIRNIFYNSEYQLAGLAGQLSAEKRFPLSDHFFFSLEGKFTAAQAKVSLDSIDLTVPNRALHLLFGLGYRL